MELDSPGAEDNSMESFRAISDALNTAVTVSVEFHGHQYKGEIVEINIGEFIAFRVTKPDDGLVRVPIDYDEITLRVLMMSGEVKSFKTRLINKNIPLLLLEFPKGAMETFIRSHPRHHVKISTPIILESRDDVELEDEVTGLGTITNLSEGGCQVATRLKLERGDKIRIFIHLTDSGAREISGVIRRVLHDSDNLENYGLRFTGLNIRTMRELEDFMKRTIPQRSERR